MYTDFFGLREVPFSIAPNPDYLFMSDRHKEALAHLTYGLGTTGGFVLLTGEVGTGKTTVSRRILEGLSNDTQAAFILNPTLSSQELLATICDEFGIFYNQTRATLKSLTDKIQERLLENHASNMNTLLIIDEAQHLKPEVLEQLRLLTNLETNTKKLLQVILIGQPELQTLLKRQDLRQLAQRITARYHLLPLTQKETTEYIYHRISVAGSHQPLFNKQAINTVHQLSKGIPRLINLLCDRALLGAYGKNKLQVDKNIVLHASKEALGDEYQPKKNWQKTAVVIFVVAALLVIGLFAYMAGQKFFAQSTPEQGIKAVVNPPSVPVNKSNTDKKIVQQPAITVSAQDKTTTLAASVDDLFALWKIDFDEPIIEPCQQAKLFNLACYWHKGNLPSLLKLNYPAVFKFIDQRSQPFYGLLVARNDKKLTFQFADSTKVVDREWLDQYWQGGALVFWQAPIDDYGELANYINEQDTLTLLQWVENKLSAEQQRPARALSSLDPLLRNQLQQFKRKQGIVEQEFAGEKTLMLLANTVDQGLPIYKVN